MSTATLVRGREARGRLPAPLTIAADRQHTAETILRAWREGKSEHTVRGYTHDLKDFALYFSRALASSPPMDVTTALGRLFHQSSPSPMKSCSASGTISARSIFQRRVSIAIWPRCAV
jgi:hypothetical protein